MANPVGSMKANVQGAGGNVDVFDCLIAITAPAFQFRSELVNGSKPLCQRFGDRRAHFGKI